jgi:hypothetical protein
MGPFIQLGTSLMDSMRKLLPSSLLPADSESYLRKRVYQLAREQIQMDAEVVRLNAELRKLKAEYEMQKAMQDARPKPEISHLLNIIRKKVADGDHFIVHFSAPALAPGTTTVHLEWEGNTYQWSDRTVAIMQLAAAGAEIKITKRSENAFVVQG